MSYGAVVPKIKSSQNPWNPIFPFKIKIAHAPRSLPPIFEKSKGKVGAKLPYTILGKSQNPYSNRMEVRSLVFHAYFGGNE